MKPPWHTCSKCGKRVVPQEGINVLFQRGYWWHGSCATFSGSDTFGYPVVAFPSEGKLIPDTIVQGEDDVKSHEAVSR